MTQPSRDNRSHRLEFLDSARGIAAIAVVLYHMLSNRGPLLNQWMVQREDLGQVGVIVFFFISGFIIPVSMERKPLGEFWRARCFRLLPAYWLAIVLTLAFGALGLLQLPQGFHEWNLRRDISALLMLPGKGGEPMLLGVAWTLSLELAFYCVCSLLKIASVLSRRLIVAWGAVGVYLLLLLAAWGHLYASHHFKAHWGGLLLAAFVGSVFYGVSKEEERAWVLPPLMLISGAAIVLGLRFEAGAGGSANTAIMSWILAAAFFVVMFLLRFRSFPKPLLWLGRISYSVYLLHGIVLAVLFERLVRVWSLANAALFSLLVVGVVAELSYRFVEVPANRLGHRRPALA